MLFEPFKIKHVSFANRVLRSSLGGRMAYYDGSVSPAWTNFERRFAESGVAGIISATIAVSEPRMSPLEYPTIHADRFVPPLRDAVAAIRKSSPHETFCYILQIGDPGGHTHTSLFSQEADSLSASATFDFLYGYRNRTIPMTDAQIDETVGEFAQAARRAREAGCDGVEVTASKGYLIHQFLNPATNRRKDAYGGSVEKRFFLLERIVRAVREAVGSDSLFGVRLSASDYNYLPLNIRLPVVWPLRNYFFGNGLPEAIVYARRLERLGVDYLHIDAGFGFPNPMGSPGSYPDAGFKSFANSTRYLSGKAEARAILFNLVPGPIRRALFGRGWRFVPAVSADLAAAIRRAVGIPVIANGGFQDRTIIDAALRDGKCDMVAIGRPLLANRDLLQQFQNGRTVPENPCTFCSACCARTAFFPLGCYDVSRFGDSHEAMMDQILEWSAPPPPDHAPAPSQRRERT